MCKSMKLIKEHRCVKGIRNRDLTTPAADILALEKNCGNADFMII